MNLRLPLLLLLLTGMQAFIAPASAQQPIAIAEISRATPVSFEDEVLPLLQKNCLGCHSASEPNGDLVLESPADMLKGGDSGPAIVAGKGAESLLLQVASHTEEPFMPPPGNDVAAVNLTPQQLGLIKLWIDQGARSTGIAGLSSPQSWRPLPPGSHPIYAVAVTPDGQFAACGRANQIFIYHVPTGRLITRLTDPALQVAGNDPRPGMAHLDVVQSLAFNQQGDRLVSGGFRTAKIWRYPRDVQRMPLVSDTAVTAVAVSPDQRWIATGSEDHSVKLWSAEQGTAGPLLAGHTEAITALCFSRDSGRLFSASLDRSVLQWNVADRTLLSRLVQPEPVLALTAVFEPLPEEMAAEAAGDAQSPSDQVPAEATAASAESMPIKQVPVKEMLVTGNGNLLHLWDIPDSLPQPLSEPLAAASQMTTSADGRYLALADAAGNIQVRDTSSGEIVNVWQSIVAGIQALAFAPLLEAPPAEAAPDAQPAEAVEVNDSAKLQLATAGDDGSVQIWTVATGELLTTLRGSPSPIGAIAFRPDGKALASGNSTGQITGWNLDAPPSQPLQDSGNPAQVAVTSLDGKLLATAELVAERPAIVVRELETGKVVSTLLGHEAPVLVLAFNADGTRLVSGSDDQTTRVWDLRDARFPQAARFNGHAAAVAAVAFNADATQALSGAADGSLKLWNIADGALVMDFPGHTAAIAGVAMLSGTQPVSSSADMTVRFWNAADGKAARSLTETAAVTALAASGDSARIAVAAGLETKIYQAADGQLLATLPGLTAAADSLSFSSDNSRLLAANGVEALVYRTADGRLLEKTPVAGPITASVLERTGSSVVLCDQGGAIMRQQLRFDQAFEGHTQSIVSLIYRSDSLALFTASTEGMVRAYNLQNGQPLFNANHGSPIHDLALSPDEQTLASAADDKVKLWNAANGGAAQPAELTGVTGPFSSVGFAAGGTKVIAASGGELPAVTVFTRVDGKPEQILRSDSPAARICLTGAEAGQQFVVGLSATGVTTQWQTSVRQRIAGHTGPVTSLASIDQLQFLSGSTDGTLRQWNLAVPNPQVLQMNHGAPITGVAAHPAAQRFASVSDNHTARLWNSANGQQLAEMKGDLRAKELVAKLTLQKTDSTAKVAIAKTTLEAAQKEVPVKTEAEKLTATALAAAQTDATAKTAEFTKTSTEKVQAEKVAIEAAAAAQTAASKMREANEKALLLVAQVERMNEKAVRTQAIAQSNPTNEELAKLVIDVVAEVAKLQEEAKAAEAAKAPPTQVAMASAKVADDAALKVTAASKPFTDAATALATAENVLRMATQAHDLAVRDLEAAKAEVPAAEMQLAQAEAALVKIDADLAAAVTVEQQALQPLRSVAFTPDGLTLATGGDFGVVHTWSAESGKEVSSFVGHAGAIHSLAWLGSDSIVSASVDKQAIVWNANPDWKLERVIGSIADPTLLIDRVVAVGFSHNGQLLATGGGVPSRSGEVKVWNVEDGSLVHAIPEAHTDEVNAVAFSADDLFLASAAADKLVKKWDVASGQQLLQFEGHTEHVLGVDWRANGQELVSAGGDATVRTWNAVNGDRIRTIEGYTKQVTDVRYVGQSQFVMAAAGDPVIRMHNADNGGTQRNYGGVEDYMYAVDVTPDGSVVVAGGHDGILRIWDGNNAQVLHSLAAPDVVADEVVASPAQP